MTFYALLQSRATNETQNALRQFQANPDWRQIAAFFLGWVFLSSVRHAWYGCFLREPIAASFSGIFRWGSRGGDLEKNQSQPSSRPDSLDGERRPDMDFLAFVLFICFGTSSLTQFFSLLFFGPGSLCTITLALGLGSSVAARVIGLFALSLELKRRFKANLCWLAVYWFLLLSALGVTAGTVFFSLGKTIAVPNLGIAICVKRHYMPTSLAASLSLIVLETYTIFHILFASELPRGLWDISTRRAAALLVFDLAVLVPDALPTNVLGDFLPFSITAIIVLSAFAGQSLSRQSEFPMLRAYSSSESSLMDSSMLEPPRNTLPTMQYDSNPTPSQRAFHNSLMGVPALSALGVDPMRRLGHPASAISPSRSMPPPLQMPQPISLAVKQLPNLPESGELDPAPRSDAATMRSSISQGHSIDDAVVQTAVRQHVAIGSTITSASEATVGQTPRSGKIMSSQVQFVNQWERQHPDGLVPAPRRNPRPRLVVDVAPRQPRISYLEMAITPEEPSGQGVAHPDVTPAHTPSGRARSKVSPAIMTPPVRRPAGRSSIGPLRSPARSPQTVESAPARQRSFISLPFLAEETVASARNKRKSSRVSHAPTFGRSRSTKHPNVPVTPEMSPDEAAGEVGELVPLPWMARSARPAKLVRGPRARPTPPSSAPPM